MPPVAEKTRDADHDARRDSVPIEDVERLVAERVEAARIGMADEVARQLAAFKESFTPTGLSSLNDKGAMEALAMAISGVTDQEIGRRRIPPEELAKRLRAREAMETLISATIERGTQPVYTLRQVCYLGEQIIQPYWVDRATRTTKATEIGWWGVPNEFMDPVNDQGMAIHALFLESIGGMKKRGANLRVTPGGLTVRSGGLAPDGGRDTAPRVGRDIHEPSIKGRNGDRPEVTTRILGTLMPAARQMV